MSMNIKRLMTKIGRFKVRLGLLVVYITVLMLFAAGAIFGVEKSHPNAGIMGASFLKLNPSARSFALASADISSPDKLSIYTNPAGVQLVTDNILSVNYVDWMFGLKSSSLVYGRFIPFFGPLVVSYLSLSTDDIGHTVDSHIPQDYFKVVNRLVTVSSSFAPNKHFIIGVTGKIINEQFYNNAAYGLAADVGGLYFTNKSAIENTFLRNIMPKQVGFALRNFGFLSPVIKVPAVTPVTFAVGVNYNFFEALDLDLQIDKEMDYFTKFKISAEYNLYDLIIFRLAADLHNRAVDLGVLSHISGGFGLNLGNYKLDYAFRSMDYFGVINELSLTIDFSEAYKGPSGLAKLKSLFKRKRGQAKAEREKEKVAPPAAISTQKETVPKELTEKETQTIGTGKTAKETTALKEAAETSAALPVPAETEVLQLLQQADTGTAPETAPSAEQEELSETAILGLIGETEAKSTAAKETAVRGETEGIARKEAPSETEILKLIGETEPKTQTSIETATLKDTKPINTNTDSEILNILNSVDTSVLKDTQPKRGK